MPKLNTENLTYCVLRSGYTGRLVDELGFTDEKKVKKNMYKMKLDKDSEGYNNVKSILEEEGYDDDDEEAMNIFYNKILFISDNLYGNGTYYVKSKNVKKILNILKSEEMELSGTICFNCEKAYDANFFISVLKKVGFCAFYGEIIDITIIEEDGEKILYYRIDAESG